MRVGNSKIVWTYYIVNRKPLLILIKIYIFRKRRVVGLNKNNKIYNCYFLCQMLIFSTAAEIDSFNDNWKWYFVKSLVFLGSTNKPSKIFVEPLWMISFGKWLLVCQKLKTVYHHHHHHHHRINRIHSKRSAFPNGFVTQSVGASEYTNCISAEGQDPPSQRVCWIWH